MDIILYINSSENNRVNKINFLQQICRLSGELREECSIITPSIVIDEREYKQVIQSQIYNYVDVIDSSNEDVVSDLSKMDISLINYNYIYIPDFKRYYYVKNIDCVCNNLYRFDLYCDVLMSFKDDIQNLECFVIRQEFNYNDMIPDKTMPSKLNPIIEYYDLAQAPLEGEYSFWNRPFDENSMVVVRLMSTETINPNTFSNAPDFDSPYTELMEKRMNLAFPPEEMYMISSTTLFKLLKNIYDGTFAKENSHIEFSEMIQSILIFPFKNPEIFNIENLFNDYITFYKRVPIEETDNDDIKLIKTFDAVNAVSFTMGNDRKYLKNLTFYFSDILQGKYFNDELGSDYDNEIINNITRKYSDTHKLKFLKPVSVVLSHTLIKPKYNNFLDYEPYTNIMLYIPYVGFVELPTNRVMGKDLCIEYLIDFVNDNSSVILSVDSTYKTKEINQYMYHNYTIDVRGEIIATYPCKLSISKPVIRDNASSRELQKTIAENKKEQGILEGAGQFLTGAFQTAVGVGSMGISTMTGVAGVTKGVSGMVGGISKIGTSIMQYNIDMELASRRNLGYGNYFGNVVENDLLQSRIIYIRPNPVYFTEDESYSLKYNHLVGKPSSYVGQLKNLNGFTQIGGTHIENIKDAVSEELDEIDYNIKGIQNLDTFYILKI